MTQVGPLVFESPVWLLALAAVPVAAAAVLLWWRDARDTGARYADPTLLDLRQPRRSRALRGAAAVSVLIALALLAVAAAAPARDATRDEERGAVVLAIDTSLSMLRDDFAPTRVEAAAQAANEMLDVAPEEISVGLISFADRAQTLVAPTAERDLVAAKLARLPEAREGTALGDAVVASLTLLSGAGLLDDPPANPDQSPARIVLLTDGAATTGLDPQLAAQRAQAVQVPVFSILVGDDPPHPRFGDPREILSLLSSQTGGTYTQTTEVADLQEVFRDIGTVLTPVTELQDLTVRFVAGALAFLALAALLAALSRPRERVLPRSSAA